MFKKSVMFKLIWKKNLPLRFSLLAINLSINNALIFSATLRLQTSSLQKFSLNS